MNGHIQTSWFSIDMRHRVNLDIVLKNETSVFVEIINDEFGDLTFSQHLSDDGCITHVAEGNLYSLIEKTEIDDTYRVNEELMRRLEKAFGPIESIM